MKKYKAVFSDIDGTLLNSKHQIPENTRKKIKQINQNGIPYVLVSARMPKGMTAIRAELEAKSPMICYSGALVVDEEDRPIYSVAMPQEVAMKLCRRVYELNSKISVNIYTNDEWLVKDKKEYWAAQESDITGVIPQEVSFEDEEVYKEVHKVLCMGDKKEGDKRMKIVVCAKQVPDTTEVKLDPKTNTLIRDGVPSIINPDDKAGIEAALQLKEKCPGSTVTVVSMGPPQADVALREALAMGCDDALLISDRAFGGADTWATSSTIAAALKKLDYDVIITGRQAIDGDTAQVGPQIAEHLGIPQVSYVEKMDVEGEDTLVVQRQFEDRHQIIEVKTPCLLTALAELADPRYMSVHGVFDAYREKEVKVWGLEDIKDTVNEGNIGLKGSPTRVKKSFTKQAKGVGTILNDLSDDEAVAAIVEKLQEKHII